MDIEEPSSTAPSLRQMHDRMCFLLGIREEWKVEKLWAEECERQKLLESRQPRQHGQKKIQKNK